MHSNFNLFNCLALTAMALPCFGLIAVVFCAAFRIH